ncbi:hypothetical protein Ciccas_000386 [Cichlidogyrus casuarinus]|uniref:Uncharacterized protein n=1 Tax=Cichlidogyrus casuarinus TaxID=1844966 RepID=A0ABD2QN31_9PLAT
MMIRFSCLFLLTLLTATVYAFEPRFCPSGSNRGRCLAVCKSGACEVILSSLGNLAQCMETELKNVCKLASKNFTSDQQLDCRSLSMDFTEVKLFARSHPNLSSAKDQDIQNLISSTDENIASELIDLEQMEKAVKSLLKQNSFYDLTKSCDNERNALQTVLQQHGYEYYSKPESTLDLVSISDFKTQLNSLNSRLNSSVSVLTNLVSMVKDKIVLTSNSTAIQVYDKDRTEQQKWEGLVRAQLEAAKRMKDFLYYSDRKFCPCNLMRMNTLERELELVHYEKKDEQMLRKLTRDMSNVLEKMVIFINTLNSGDMYSLNQIEAALKRVNMEEKANGMSESNLKITAEMSALAERKEERANLKELISADIAVAHVLVKWNEASKAKLPNTTMTNLDAIKKKLENFQEILVEEPADQLLTNQEVIQGFELASFFNSFLQRTVGYINAKITKNATALAELPSLETVFRKLIDLNYWEKVNHLQQGYYMIDNVYVSSAVPQLPMADLTKKRQNLNQLLTAQVAVMNSFLDWDKKERKRIKKGLCSCVKKKIKAVLADIMSMKSNLDDSNFKITQDIYEKMLESARQISQIVEKIVSYVNEKVIVGKSESELSSFKDVIKNLGVMQERNKINGLPEGDLKLKFGKKVKKEPAVPQKVVDLYYAQLEVAQQLYYWFVDLKDTPNYTQYVEKKVITDLMDKLEEVFVKPPTDKEIVAPGYLDGRLLALTNVIKKLNEQILTKLPDTEMPQTNALSLALEQLSKAQKAFGKPQSNFKLVKTKNGLEQFYTNFLSIQLRLADLLKDWVNSAKKIANITQAVETKVFTNNINRIKKITKVVKRNLGVGHIKENMKLLKIVIDSLNDQVLAKIPEKMHPAPKLVYSIRMNIITLNFYQQQKQELGQKLEFKSEIGQVPPPLHMVFMGEQILAKEIYIWLTSVEKSTKVEAEEVEELKEIMKNIFNRNDTLASMKLLRENLVILRQAMVKINELLAVDEGSKDSRDRIRRIISLLKEDQAIFADFDFDFEFAAKEPSKESHNQSLDKLTKKLASILAQWLNTTLQVSSLEHLIDRNEIRTVYLDKLTKVADSGEAVTDMALKSSFLTVKDMVRKINRYVLGKITADIVPGEHLIEQIHETMAKYNVKEQQMGNDYTTKLEFKTTAGEPSSVMKGFLKDEVKLAEALVSWLEKVQKNNQTEVAIEASVSSLKEIISSKAKASMDYLRKVLDTLKNNVHFVNMQILSNFEQTPEKTLLLNVQKNIQSLRDSEEFFYNLSVDFAINFPEDSKITEHHRKLLRVQLEVRNYLKKWLKTAELDNKIKILVDQTFYNKTQGKLLEVADKPDMINIKQNLDILKTVIEQVNYKILSNLEAEQVPGVKTVEKIRASLELLNQLEERYKDQLRTKLELQTVVGDAPLIQQVYYATQQKLAEALKEWLESLRDSKNGAPALIENLIATVENVFLKVKPTMKAIRANMANLREVTQEINRNILSKCQPDNIPMHEQAQMVKDLIRLLEREGAAFANFDAILRFECPRFKTDASALTNVQNFYRLEVELTETLLEFLEACKKQNVGPLDEVKALVQRIEELQKYEVKITEVDLSLVYKTLETLSQVLKSAQVQVITPVKAESLPDGLLEINNLIESLTALQKSVPYLSIVNLKSLRATYENVNINHHDMYELIKKLAKELYDWLAVLKDEKRVDQVQIRDISIYLDEVYKADDKPTSEFLEGELKVIEAILQSIDDDILSKLDRSQLPGQNFIVKIKATIEKITQFQKEEFSDFDLLLQFKDWEEPSLEKDAVKVLVAHLLEFLKTLRNDTKISQQLNKIIIEKLLHRLNVDGQDQKILEEVVRNINGYVLNRIRENDLPNATHFAALKSILSIYNKNSGTDLQLDKFKVDVYTDVAQSQFKLAENMYYWLEDLDSVEGLDELIKRDKNELNVIFSSSASEKVEKDSLEERRQILERIISDVRNKIMPKLKPDQIAVEKTIKLKDSIDKFNKAEQSRLRENSQRLSPTATPLSKLGKNYIEKQLEMKDQLLKILQIFATLEIKSEGNDTHVLNHNFLAKPEESDYKSVDFVRDRQEVLDAVMTNAEAKLDAIDKQKLKNYESDLMKYKKSITQMNEAREMFLRANSPENLSLKKERNILRLQKLMRNDLINWLEYMDMLGIDQEKDHNMIIRLNSKFELLPTAKQLLNTTYFDNLQKVLDKAKKQVKESAKQIKKEDVPQPGLEVLEADSDAIRLARKEMEEKPTLEENYEKGRNYFSAQFKVRNSLIAWFDFLTAQSSQLNVDQEEVSKQRLYLQTYFNVTPSMDDLLHSEVFFHENSMILDQTMGNLKKILEKVPKSSIPTELVTNLVETTAHLAEAERIWKKQVARVTGINKSKEFYDMLVELRDAVIDWFKYFRKHPKSGIDVKLIEKHEKLLTTEFSTSPTEKELETLEFIDDKKAIVEQSVALVKETLSKMKDTPAKRVESWNILLSKLEKVEKEWENEIGLNRVLGELYNAQVALANFITEWLEAISSASEIKVDILISKVSNQFDREPSYHEQRSKVYLQDNNRVLVECLETINKEIYPKLNIGPIPAKTEEADEIIERWQTAYKNAFPEERIKKIIFGQKAQQVSELYKSQIQLANQLNRWLLKAQQSDNETLRIDPITFTNIIHVMQLEMELSKQQKVEELELTDVAEYSDALDKVIQRVNSEVMPLLDGQSIQVDEELKQALKDYSELLQKILKKAALNFNEPGFKPKKLSIKQFIYYTERSQAFVTVLKKWVSKNQTLEQIVMDKMYTTQNETTRIVKEAESKILTKELIENLISTVKDQQSKFEQYLGEMAEMFGGKPAMLQKFEMTKELDKAIEFMKRAEVALGLKAGLYLGSSTYWNKPEYARENQQDEVKKDRLLGVLSAQSWVLSEIKSFANRLNSSSHEDFKQNANRMNSFDMYSAYDSETSVQSIEQMVEFWQTTLETNISTINKKIVNNKLLYQVPVLRYLRYSSEFLAKRRRSARIQERSIKFTEKAKLVLRRDDIKHASNIQMDISAYIVNWFKKLDEIPNLSFNLSQVHKRVVQFNQDGTAHADKVRDILQNATKKEQLEKAINEITSFSTKIIEFIDYMNKDVIPLIPVDAIPQIHYINYPLKSLNLVEKKLGLAKTEFDIKFRSADALNWEYVDSELWHILYGSNMLNYRLSRDLEVADIMGLEGTETCQLYMANINDQLEDIWDRFMDNNSPKNKTLSVELLDKIRVNREGVINCFQMLLDTKSVSEDDIESTREYFNRHKSSVEDFVELVLEYVLQNTGTAVREIEKWFEGIKDSYKQIKEKLSALDKKSKHVYTQYYYKDIDRAQLEVEVDSFLNLLGDIIKDINDQVIRKTKNIPSLTGVNLILQDQEDLATILQKKTKTFIITKPSSITAAINWISDLLKQAFAQSSP